MAVATTDIVSPKSKNTSSSSGAVDIIIIKHDNDTFKSTPFHVRFGKYLAEYPFNLKVNIKINDEKLNNLSMTLNKNGIAHFDGPQPFESEKKKQEKEEEEKAETIAITDNGNNDIQEKNMKIKVDKMKSDKIDSNETENISNASKRVRKRDKLRSFVQSSWSYWSGSENEEEQETEQKDINEEKIRKRDIVKSYITNKLESQWMIEQDVIDINNIPNNENIKTFVSKLKYGKNKIIFSIKTRSKMDKFKKKIYKQTDSLKRKYNNNNNINDTKENNGSDNDVINTMNITDFGTDIELKERIVSGNIYLWNNCDRIIISDVDGTITKSDIGGHVLPKIGFDYVQNGICNILNRVNSNGYRIIYLTARGIGQSSITRNYLFNELNVPNGAVICSSSTIRAALYREVIQKRPQDFKIPTLNMIINAFHHNNNNNNNNNNPFVGGFGNRETDAKTYKYFGIHKSKIFIIGYKQKDIEKNKEQQVIATYINDYNQIFENINDIFPKLVTKQEIHL